MTDGLTGSSVKPSSLDIAKFSLPVRIAFPVKTPVLGSFNSAVKVGQLFSSWPVSDDVDKEFIVAKMCESVRMRESLKYVCLKWKWCFRFGSAMYRVEWFQILKFWLWWTPQCSCMCKGWKKGKYRMKRENHLVLGDKSPRTCSTWK